ncbi:hypothetical protein SELMODRAFT_425093 [Selaginella moellendorffii]|uniref:Reverse transcriptase zinc-binding domain-containing protein n=1 Tax=Selaginella moellendorffii TaxID=88036 RepID=D8SS03_SELML|nr:hypothetical protein SELMODRAFT_425093 [Selaginella moellendorffii]
MPLPGCGTALQDMNEASKEDLLSSAFADDTSLIVEGSPENLSNVKRDLDFFNEAMGSKINWHKSVGLWLPPGRPPTWGTELGFKWLDTEETTRYLGFQVGRQYDPEPQNRKAVTILRDQLKFWASRKLSFSVPARCVVANSILLGVIWFLAACWNMDRMLMPGHQPWRILLRAQFLKVLPDRNEHTRQNWASDKQWLFSDTKLKMTKAHTFSGKLFKLWRQFKCKLERKPPRTKEQLDRQPIFLSKLFAVKGKTLGASEDRGLDQTCRDLHRAGMRTFAEADTMIQPNQMAHNRDRISAFYGLTISEHRMRNFQTAFLAAKHACLERLNLQEDQHHRWWKVDESIVCTLPNMALGLVFEAGQAGRLYPIITPEYEDLPDMSRAKPIRVIQMEKKTANVDPLIPENQYARLYWFRQQTLDELKWDPTEWHWRGTMCKDFFQYETKLGRKLIRVPTRSSLIRKAKAQQIRSRNHSHCINKIWKGRWSAKNRYFMWLAQQERLPSLVAIHLSNTACKTCGTTETQRHILWECLAAQEVWEGAAAVLKRMSTGGAAITYESALWGSFIQGKTKNPDAWKWRHNEAPHFDQLNQTQTHITHLHQELFDALRGCTLAEIWKARCTRLFEDTDPSARATISKVWSRLIVSLAARLDTLIKRGEEGRIAKEKKLWPFFRGRSEAGEEEWMWKPPIWIWQHMFRNEGTCTSPSRQSSTPGTSEAWTSDITGSSTSSTLSPSSHPPLKILKSSFPVSSMSQSDSMVYRG